ncbi:hypothetical protein PR048_017093 [Dryococelus australis]|uniref:Uncharacterized protein n=1 Tax=Dryococelus australis TaxID=614101 RepID=A0ABQ9H8J8_9NEOP|nr:hypothetical protein PR048_017093 [Dryococelus australis]
MSYKTYYEYFKTKFGYSFQKSKTDICDFCVACTEKFKVNLTDPCHTLLMVRRRKYARRKKIRDECIERAGKDETLLVIEFDYAQNFVIPKVSVNSQFYKRLLWLYCFSVHGKKNSNSVVSFLYDCYLLKKMQVFRNVKTIVFLSDAAGGGGGNKNITKFLAPFRLGNRSSPFPHLREARCGWLTGSPTTPDMLSDFSVDCGDTLSENKAPKRHLRLFEIFRGCLGVREAWNGVKGVKIWTKMIEESTPHIVDTLGGQHSPQSTSTPAGEFSQRQFANLNIYTRKPPLSRSPFQETGTSAHLIQSAHSFTNTTTSFSPIFSVWYEFGQPMSAKGTLSQGTPVSPQPATHEGRAIVSRCERMNTEPLPEEYWEEVGRTTSEHNSIECHQTFGDRGEETTFLPQQPKLTHRDPSLSRVGETGRKAVIALKCHPYNQLCVQHTSPTICKLASRGREYTPWRSVHFRSGHTPNPSLTTAHSIPKHRSLSRTHSVKPSGQTILFIIMAATRTPTAANEATIQAVSAKKGRKSPRTVTPFSGRDGGDLCLANPKVLFMCSNARNPGQLTPLPLTEAGARSAEEPAVLCPGLASLCQLQHYLALRAVMPGGRLLALVVPCRSSGMAFLSHEANFLYQQTLLQHESRLFLLGEGDSRQGDPAPRGLTPDPLAALWNVVSGDEGCGDSCLGDPGICDLASQYHKVPGPPLLLGLLRTPLLSPADWLLVFILLCYLRSGIGDGLGVLVGRRWLLDLTGGAGSGLDIRCDDDLRCQGLCGVLRGWLQFQRALGLPLLPEI